MNPKKNDPDYSKNVSYNTNEPSEIATEILAACHHGFNKCELCSKAVRRDTAKAAARLEEHGRKHSDDMID